MKLSTALSVFTLSTVLAIGAFGQGTPDCQWTDPYTAAVAGPSHANTSAGNSPCVVWRLTYDAAGMTAVSIQIEGAPCGNATCTSPGTFAAIASGAIVQGTNPLTDPDCSSGLCTLVVGGTVYYPFIRTNVTTFTPTGATGTITARLKGTSGLAGLGAAPTGPCGGDLAGSFPNCTVIGTNGLLLPVSADVVGTNASGQIVASTTIPAADGNTSVQYNSNGLLAGDSTKFAWFETSIGTPAAPTVTQHGAAGAVTYAYQIAWLTLAGNGPGGAIATTTTGNAVLSATNYNIITPPACPATASGYIVERSTDPNGNTGTLPVTGVCGSPVNDVYGATFGGLNTLPSTSFTTPDLSVGLYAKQITSPMAIFGENPLTLGGGISQAALPSPINMAWQFGSTFGSTLSVYSEGTRAFSINGASVVDNGGYGTGLSFGTVYTGAGAASNVMNGSSNYLAVTGAGSVPGWSAAYAFGGEYTLSTGNFTNVAVYDCGAGLFQDPAGTGENACVHNLQVPIAGSTIYFLLEEGGLPSKLAGSLTITPLKSTTGQRFVCVDNAGLLHSSTTACVGT